MVKHSQLIKTPRRFPDHKQRTTLISLDPSYHFRQNVLLNTTDTVGIQIIKAFKCS